MMGLAQPVRSFSSRRRSVLRLQRARRCRMVAFTRNPPGEACLTGQQLIKHRGNTEGFRVFQENYPPGARNLACSRPRGPPQAAPVDPEAREKPKAAYSRTELADRPETG